MAGPAVGSVHDGYRFKGGNPNDQSSWEEVAGPKARSDMGPGVFEYEDGSIWRQGPRGGAELLQPAKPKPGDDGSYAGVKLTEDQGKAQTYGRLMAIAEQQYQEAEGRGYRPGSVSNVLGNVAEDFRIPGLGTPFAGLAPTLRTDVEDEAAAARRAWLDAQLKAMTGAGQSGTEQVENPRTYFPQAGDAAGENKGRLRQEAYKAVRTRAGPQGALLPEYPDPTKPKPLPNGKPRARSFPGSTVGNREAGFSKSLNAKQQAAAKLFAKNAGKVPAGQKNNPYMPTSMAEFSAMPEGSWYLDDDGLRYQKGK